MAKINIPCYHHHHRIRCIGTNVGPVNHWLLFSSWSTWPCFPCSSCSSFIPIWSSCHVLCRRQARRLNWRRRISAMPALSTRFSHHGSITEIWTQVIWFGINHFCSLDFMYITRFLPMKLLITYYWSQKYLKFSAIVNKPCLVSYHYYRHFINV